MLSRVRIPLSEAELYSDDTVPCVDPSVGHGPDPVTLGVRLLPAAPATWEATAPRSQAAAGLCSPGQHGADAPLPAARVLAARGGEGLPRGRALRQGGHQHPWQRLPGGEVRTVFKVPLDAPAWVLWAGRRLSALVRAGS